MSKRLSAAEEAAIAARARSIPLHFPRTWIGNPPQVRRDAEALLAELTALRGERDDALALARELADERTAREQAEARLADTEEGRLVEYNRARMYDLALSAALANPDSAADAAQHVIDTYRWVGEDAPRVQALQARLEALEKALTLVYSPTCGCDECRQIRAALAALDK